jgi:GTP1/Obg family GTP-binding protein
MTKYNGWSNYETWNFKLWLDNDEDLHNYIIGEIKKIKEIGTSHIHEVSEVSNFLRSYIEDNVPSLMPLSDKNGFYNDILNAALRDISTYEIAESYLEDLK